MENNGNTAVLTEPPTTTELTPDVRGLVDHAQAMLDKGDITGAVRSLEAARGLCPENADIVVALGNLYFQLGSLPESFNALEQAAKLRPNDPLVHILLATIAIRLNRISEFESAVSRALKLDNAFAPAHRLLADLHLEAGNYVEAAREYGILIKQNPNDIPVLLALGKCMAEAREIESAEACFQYALDLDPTNQIAAQNLNVLRSRPRHPGVYSQTAAATDPSLETIACPFCQSRHAEQVRRSADIVRCCDCETVYLRTRAKKEVMERLYQTYADDGSHMALPKTFEDADRAGLKRDYFLKEILQFTKPEGKLLDVGCGWGAFLLNGRQHGFDVSGLEITRKAAGYANQSLQIPVKTTQFLETDYAPDSHNVVTMLHVFEHLPYPKQALEKVFQILKPGGMFCGIVPNFSSFCSQALGERWYWLDPNYHYVHYTPATLRKHLENAGFVVERIYTETGDYGGEPIRKLLEPNDPTVNDPSVFNTRLKQIENDGRGEEIRFFARKPGLAAPSCSGVSKIQAAISKPKFTAHNIRLQDGSFTKPGDSFTSDNPILISAKRVLETVFPGDKSQYRIADLGCLEGGYAVEFARMGFRSVGVEVRDSNFAACRFVKEHLDLPNLDFIQDDAWNIGKHGPFDAIFCCGLLYHIDRPKLFLEKVAAATTKLLILNTHFSTELPNSLYQLSGMEVNEALPGRWYREFSNDSEFANRDEMHWSSWDNYRSFWIRREHLIQTVRDVGFDFVFEQFDGLGINMANELIEGNYCQHQRGQFVGIKTGIKQRS
ncbi:MAG TPA: methyltransferase domain-containing protein [Candidatus Paceibacterota bacterium]|nr:methyltransferase domain-containing protein [Candidatus Paceibacterota bacterium]